MTRSPQRRQRLPLRLFNRVQRILARLGRRQARFLESEAALHEAAAARAGCDDFGDPAYREGLRILLEAYDREAKLTPFGRLMARRQVLGLLENRLAAQKAWSAAPELLTHEIRRPIFVLGLPRTGTTALHHLLGQDPGIRVLPYWLAAAPQPCPPRSEWERNPRFKAAVRDLKTMYYLDPSLKAMHVMTADGPEECRHLFCQSFTDDTFFDNATIPSYSRWFKQNPLRESYVHHRNLLRLIGSPQPEHRWVLKYPVHMRKLKALFEVYPDACIVQTHRDPTRVLGSLCSLIAGWRALYEDDVDPHAIGAEQLDHWASGMVDAMEVRREQDPSCFLDLHFREVLDDPIAAVRRVYQRFGLALGDEAERRMRSWHAENPRGKHGEHLYRLEDFGLNDRVVLDRYAPYVEHFRVEREASA